MTGQFDKSRRLTDRLRDLLRQQYGGINDSLYGELDRIDAYAPMSSIAPQPNELIEAYARLRTALITVRDELDPEELADHDEGQIGTHIEHAHMVALNAIEKSPDSWEIPSAASAIVPSGWKLVPVEPTHEMVKAYKNAMRKYIDAAKKANGTDRWTADSRGYVIPEREKAYARWNAMLAAAPNVTSDDRAEKP